MRDVGVLQQPPGHPIQQEKLSENTRLREQISQLEQELKQTQEKKEKYEQKFFEARVAVMGFKCRTMQLQGEVESLRRKLSETVRVAATSLNMNMKLDVEHFQVGCGLCQVWE